MNRHRTIESYKPRHLPYTLVRTSSRQLRTEQGKLIYGFDVLSYVISGRVSQSE